jgi:hypothetical protein
MNTRLIDPAPQNANFDAAVRDSFARQTLMSTMGVRIVDMSV